MSSPSWSLSAHRGFSARHPENTLTAFRAALEAGAAGIELDVALSADGVPVIMHDDTLDRTTDGSGAVADLTLAELRALDAGDGGPVPTLAEVLGLAAGEAEVNIEIKAGDAARAVLAVAHEVSGRAPLRWFLSSGQWDALREAHELDPGARLYVLSTGVADLDELRTEAIEAGHPAAEVNRQLAEARAQGLEHALALADDLSAEGISVWERSLTAADLARIHAAGRVAWVWTVNDPARARELVVDGADVICTDEPEALAAALRD